MFLFSLIITLLFSDFLSWKSKVEFDTNALFVSNGCSKKNNGEEIKYFICNRFGEFFSRSVVPDDDPTKKQTKKQGSCKIGKHCPAQMIVRLIKPDQVVVTFTTNHYGHEKEAAHLPIDQSTVETVRSNLEQGVPIDRIWRDVRK